MDTTTLFNLIRELSDKVGVLSEELAAIKVSVGWLEWWSKLLITGTIGNILIGGMNSVLLYRNGKNAKKD